MSLHDESPETVIARESSFLVTTYARTDFHPRSGEGCQLVDASGRKYWDLLAGIAVNALGYNHPALNAALSEASTGLLHLSNLYYHPAQGLLAEKLAQASGLSKVFFCNSGTEANEAAIKFARLVNPGRTEIVALDESFHGRTIGALSLTGHAAYREPFAPLLDGVKYVQANDVDALKSSVSEKTTAIFLEPIQGEGGVIPLTQEFMQAAAGLAQTTGALLVLDEIQCGLGRTGSLFAFQHYGITPDIVTLAKPLGGGLPLGAVVTGKRLDGVVKPGHHGTTFGGNPVACQLGIALLDEIATAGLLGKIESDGAWFAEALTAFAESHAEVIDVRGKGLMWGIELNQPARPVAKALLEKGFVVGTARDNVIRLLPPYIVPREVLASFIEVLGQVLKTELVAAG